MELEESLQRMYNEQLYYADDPSLGVEQGLYLEKLFHYNQLPPSKRAEKQALLNEMFAAIGEDCYIETPFHANWGGKHVYFGHHVYANFNLTLVDDCAIRVGNYVMFGPNVTVATGTHPIHPALRQKQAQYNLPVTIEDNVWIDASSVILPGVTIGKNSVIGAGSIVTKDIPANVVAVGNPCRVLREISAHDLAYYHKDKKIDM